MRVVAIVQARMGSSRFPGKVLRPLTDGMTVLEVLLKRISKSKLISETVVATTDSKLDDELVNWLVDKNFSFFRGSETDVLQRFAGCAKKFHADVIVRLTADDPLKDPAIIDRAVGIFMDKRLFDYVSNTKTPTFPEGLDVEVFSKSALLTAHDDAVKPSEREHVTPYIWKNDSIFSCHNFRSTPDYSAIRLTVDTQEDLDFIRKLMARLEGDINATYEQLIDALDECLMAENKALKTVRNAGYIKSIVEEI